MPPAKPVRNHLGHFSPGHSGNPGGRPRDKHKLAELARSYTSEAVETLVELMRFGKDERVRGTAAQALLDRGWGKPKQEITGPESGPEGYLALLQQVNERIRQREL